MQSDGGDQKCNVAVSIVFQEWAVETAAARKSRCDFIVLIGCQFDCGDVSFSRRLRGGVSILAWAARPIHVGIPIWIFS